MLSIERNDRDVKRRRSLSPDPGPPTKKQQREQDHPDHWVPSERFWDTLPRIYLTRRALIEHDHRNRNRNRLQDSMVQPPQRRSTRLQELARGKQFQSLCSADSKTELRRFTRHGGPDLTTIRGFPDPTMSNQTSQPSNRTISSKTSGPYDRNYQLKLAQAGISLMEEIDENDDIVLPANYDEIVARLGVPRASLSPSRFTEKDFQKFRRQTKQEMHEADTMLKSMAIIEGSGRGIYSRMGGPFNNLEAFDPELAMVVPDSYDGAPPLSIDHRVLNELAQTIVPSTDSSRPAAPNFFLEERSRAGRAEVAIRQAGHNGAIGARAMASLQSYPSRAPTYYDGNAYSFTSTYHDGQLKLYTSHVTAPTKFDRNAYSFTNTYHNGTLKIHTVHVTAPTTAGGPPQYYMSQLGAFAMTNSSKTFREGATYYRNARDLAKEQRNSLIQHANQMAQRAPTSKHSGGTRTSANSMSMRSTDLGEEGGGGAQCSLHPMKSGKWSKRGGGGHRNAWGQLDS